MWKQLYLSLLIAAGVLAVRPAEALIPLAVEDEEGNVTLEMMELSISELPVFKEDGSFEAKEAEPYLGYDPSRSWSAGDRPEDVIKFGDLQYYGIQDLSIEEISYQQGKMFYPERLPLEEIELIKDLDLKTITQTVKDFKTLRVRDVPPVFDILGSRYAGFKISTILDKNIRQVGQNQRKESIAQLRIQALDALKLAEGEVKEAIVSGISGLTLDSDVPIDSSPEPEATLAQIEQTTNANLQQRLDEAIEYQTMMLTGRIDFFLQINDDASSNRIEQFINTETERYSQDLEAAVRNEIDSILDTVETTIDTQLTEAITQKLTELTAIATTEISEITTKVRETIASSVSKQIGSLGPTEKRSYEIGEIVLSDYDLNSYSAEDLPGVTQTKVSNFPNFGNASVSDVPGAATLDFNQYPKLPNFGTGIARVDLVFSEAEGYAERAISGGDRVGYQYATCTTGNNLNGGCAHVELGGPLFFNRGKQWVTGDSQEVKGGHGILQGVNGGKEPTGRMPFPESSFKMVFRDANEQTDEVQMNMAFRYGFYDWLRQPHFTPYGVFEIPLVTYKVSDLIYLGIP